MEGNEAQTRLCLRRMGDDLFQTEQELRLFRLDLEKIRRHGQRIAFCLLHIKLNLRQIVPHLLLLEAEER
ncbi:hypothetical protein VU08_00800 [Desulfobulbus sp. F5]|nr:hypothetical protein [Desulfobulbus sp. F5]